MNGIDAYRTAGWPNMNVPVLFEPGGVREAAAQVPVVDEQLRKRSSYRATTPCALRFETIIVDDQPRLEIGYRRARHRQETIRPLLDGCRSVLGLLAGRAGGHRRGPVARVRADAPA